MAMAGYEYKGINQKPTVRISRFPGLPTLVQIPTNAKEPYTHAVGIVSLGVSGGFGLGGFSMFSRFMFYLLKFMRFSA